MNTCASNGEPGDGAGKEFYYRTLVAMNRAKVPYLIGGAYALQVYTGIARDTKDVDLFVRPEDCERALKALAETGCQTELTFPHWLGKAHCRGYFADIIFSSRHRGGRVDDGLFEHAVDGELLRVPVRLRPAGEMS